MQIKHLSSKLWLAALLLICAGHATASLITITFSGTVENSFDQTGIFGTPGQTLDGETYRLEFRFNTDGRLVSTGPDHSELYGRPIYQEPRLGETHLTIGGNTFHIAGNFASNYVLNFGVFPDPDTRFLEAVSHDMEVTSVPETHRITQRHSVTQLVWDDSGTLPTSIFSSFSMALPGTHDPDADFFDFYTIAHDDIAQTSVYEERTYGDFYATQLDVVVTGQPSQIPEPSSLALLVAGISGALVFRKCQRPGTV
ncbi:MAG: PEP-CTERM sorting domain-containing protein [Burkholderiaceae bacterium]|nr:PEP-CTERM sorting domain-containing protein [Burkholderiaceae bacterium]